MEKNIRVRIQYDDSPVSSILKMSNDKFQEAINDITKLTYEGFFTGYTLRTEADNTDYDYTLKIFFEI